MTCSGDHAICSECDTHDLGGTFSTMSPEHTWPKCELCGKPTINRCTNEHKAAIVERTELRELVRRLRRWIDDDDVRIATLAANAPVWEELAAIDHEIARLGCAKDPE